MSDEIQLARQEEHRLTRIEQKVDGINARLDISNGRLGKVEGEVRMLQNQDIASKASKRTIGWLFTGGIAVGGFISAIIFNVINTL